MSDCCLMPVHGDRKRIRLHAEMADDKLSGGPGDRDEVGGGLGIDLVNGGPGDEDLVHGDYGWDRMDGGPGRGDIASFATNVAGGRGAGIWASLRAGKAREDVEGSFDWDVLIGDARDNNLLGQPGRDRFYGGGGDDVIDARDSERDFAIQCGRRGRPEGRALVDRSDPAPTACAKRREGRPIHHLSG